MRGLRLRRCHPQIILGEEGVSFRWTSRYKRYNLVSVVLHLLVADVVPTSSSIGRCGLLHLCPIETLLGGVRESILEMMCFKRCECRLIPFDTFVAELRYTSLQPQILW